LLEDLNGSVRELSSDEIPSTLGVELGSAPLVADAAIGLAFAIRSTPLAAAAKQPAPRARTSNELINKAIGLIIGELLIIANGAVAY